ncbi:MAG: hypothetical protein BMS9Abin05_1833 [Rhodothermia bacterium]|nr:MAG: hypothetical protein BMS9Abin05_1833 [Rhodothermia bacterium]
MNRYSFGFLAITIVALFSPVLSNAQGQRVEVRSFSGLTLESIDFFDADHGTVVGQNGLIVRTVDGGETWTFQVEDSPGAAELRGVHFVDINTG